MSGIHLMDSLYIFIQARSSSTRLPLKVIKPFTDSNFTILDHLHSRIEEVILREKIVFLIPQGDKPLINFLRNRNFNFFEGDENNVRDRFVRAGNYYNAKKIIRITGDNPFIDISHLELLVDAFLRSSADLISFTGLPIGMGAEAFTLESISLNFDYKDYHNEHVSLHIKENPNDFNIFRLKPLLEIEPETLKNIRVTIDEESDFEVCKNIFNSIKNSHFGISDLLELYSKNPEIFKANKDVKQITFNLPSFKKDNPQKITIFYGNTKEFGSGHYERSKILYILLQLNGYEVIFSDKKPYSNNSNLYIIDSRDINIPEEIKQNKILLIDNFGNDCNDYSNFYSLPNPQYSTDFIKDNILFSSIIDTFKDEINKYENKILIYAGILNEEYSDNLDNFCIQNFPKYDIIRIGGSPSKLNIQWIKRLSKKSFLKELSSSNAFISYFGQGVMEALYLQKKIYIYSISDYHESLSNHLLKTSPVINLGNIQNLNIKEEININKKVLFTNNGYSNLLKLILDLLLK
jgi:spore coat polysaccharide biosynthesis protein SpsF